MGLAWCSPSGVHTHWRSRRAGFAIASAHGMHTLAGNAVGCGVVRPGPMLARMHLRACVRVRACTSGASALASLYAQPCCHCKEKPCTPNRAPTAKRRHHHPHAALLRPGSVCVARRGCGCYPHRYSCPPLDEWLQQHPRNWCYKYKQLQLQIMYKTESPTSTCVTSCCPDLQCRLLHARAGRLHLKCTPCCTLVPLLKQALPAICSHLLLHTGKVRALHTYSCCCCCCCFCCSSSVAFSNLWGVAGGKGLARGGKGWQ